MLSSVVGTETDPGASVPRATSATSATPRVDARRETATAAAAEVEGAQRKVALAVPPDGVLWLETPMSACSEGETAQPAGRAPQLCDAWDHRTVLRIEASGADGRKRRIHNLPLARARLLQSPHERQVARIRGIRASIHPIPTAVTRTEEMKTDQPKDQLGTRPATSATAAATRPTYEPVMK